MAFLIVIAVFIAAVLDGVGEQRFLMDWKGERRIAGGVENP